jgi:hypothetical protein
VFDWRYEPPRVLPPYPRCFTLSPWRKVKAGERIWGREAWRALAKWDHVAPRDIPAGEPLWYEADGPLDEPHAWGKLRPSMFMPRWACRLELAVTADARIERLQAISEADAQAESCHPASYLRGDDDIAVNDVMMREAQRTGRMLPIPWPVARYAVLWDSINGGGPQYWDANPWVVVLAFQRKAP